MQRFLIAVSAAVVILGTACSDASSPTSDSSNQMSLTMASAYTNVPAGFSELNSSFIGDEGMAFQPTFNRWGEGGLGGRGYFHGPGFGLGLGFMGGGLFGGFLGEGFGRASFIFDRPCTFAADTGIITCGPVTRNGITSTRTVQFQDASGASQPAFDTTTDKVTRTASVTGTATRRDSSTSTVDEASNQVVSGLGPASTERTVNSTSKGTETTTGKSWFGAFTAMRSAGDTVTGVVIPAASDSNHFPFPRAGTIVREISVSVTLDTVPKKSFSRREVITYDGSKTAKVTITQNGETQDCTLPLPFGRLSCSK
jgi:hypothetical protein